MMKASVGSLRAEQFRAARSGSSSAIISKNLCDVLGDLERVCDMISNDVHSPLLAHMIASLHFNMKLMGQQMESLYKDEMDRRFVQLRDGCRDRRLSAASRLRLLELVELRALPLAWTGASAGQLQYYRQALQMVQTMSSPALQHVSAEPAVCSSLLLHQQSAAPPLSNGTARHVVAARPQRVQHKHRSEIIIRNADSGKVMGVKGLRVHKIEELSSTVISLQRVPPGAKERAVQISGPEEANVMRARSLIENVIRRNASPSRDDGHQVELLFPSSASVPPAPSPSNSSTCSSSCGSHSVGDVITGGTGETTMEEVQWRRAAALPDSRSLLTPASFPSQSAGLGQYRYTVTVGDQAIRVVGPHANLVKTAKLVLDEYFGVVCSMKQQSLCDAHSSNQQTKPHRKTHTANGAADDTDHSGKSVTSNSNPVSGGGDAGNQDCATNQDEPSKLRNGCVSATKDGAVTAAGDVSAASSAELLSNKSSITQYTRSSLLMYARSVVARYPPANWSRARQLAPKVARKSSRDWDLEAFANRDGKGDQVSDMKSVDKSDTSDSQTKPAAC